MLSAPLAAAAAAEEDLRLWYRQPAPDWNEALPIGGGRLVAMIFGGVAEERWRFNKNSLSEEAGFGDFALDVPQDFDRVEPCYAAGIFVQAADVIAQKRTGRSWPRYQPNGRPASGIRRSRRGRRRISTRVKFGDSDKPGYTIGW